MVRASTKEPGNLRKHNFQKILNIWFKDKNYEYRIGWKYLLWRQAQPRQKHNVWRQRPEFIVIAQTFFSEQTWLRRIYRYSPDDLHTKTFLHRGLNQRNGIWKNQQGGRGWQNRRTFPFQAYIKMLPFIVCPIYIRFLLYQNKLFQQKKFYKSGTKRKGAFS